MRVALLRAERNSDGAAWRAPRLNELDTGRLQEDEFSLFNFCPKSRVAANLLELSPKCLVNLRSSNGALLGPTGERRSSTKAERIESER